MNKIMCVLNFLKLKFISKHCGLVGFDRINSECRIKWVIPLRKKQQGPELGDKCTSPCLVLENEVPLNSSPTCYLQKLH